MAFRRFNLICATLLLGSSPDEGLPDNHVTGVAQTSDGFLWVATFGGLMRFNGTRFEEFSVMHLEDVPNRVG